MNALNPNQLTAAERLEEIADLLAAGLMRLRARQSSPFSPDNGESSLDFSADQSGHAAPKRTRGARMKDTVLARLAALKTAQTTDLKQQWRDLFETEPRPITGGFWSTGSHTESRSWPMAG